MSTLLRLVPGTRGLAILTAFLGMLTAALALGGARLLPWSPHWYAPIHAVLEACSVVLALLMFSIGAHMAARRVPAAVALLSSSALAVGLLGIGHLLSIPVLAGAEAPESAAGAGAFALVARAVCALALLAAALVPAGRMLERRAYRLWALAAAAVAAAGYWLALVRPDLVPPTFVPGRGMTRFSAALECTLIGMNAAAALVLLARARRAPAAADRYLVTAAAVTGLSGINFTLDLGPGDVSDMLAHLYRVLAFLCLYLAIVRDGLHGAAPGAARAAAAAGPAQERIDLESMLAQAIERNQLVLQYQPRIRVKDGSIVGVEALVRWRHPVLGLLAPARFIPLAEQSGLINDIDLWVLREACTRAAAWRAAGLLHGRVSVNLSARQFQQPGLAQRVRAALDDSGLDPAGLELEITESMVMHDTEDAAEVLRSLRDLGVFVSIDDFGTGYSSLSYLKRFPLDVLKIDRAFVQDMVGDPTGTAIIRAIITLAHSLGLAAVAEGVETAEQVAFLKDNGCDQIQGYYFSRPVWPEQLAHLLMEEVPVPC